MKKNQGGFSVIEALLILVIVGAIGFVGWYVWHARNNTDSIYKAAANASTVAKSSKSAASPAPAATPATPAAIPAALKENTAAAISSQNTAALQGYMTDSVNVVIAGSEKSGAESSLQAVKDLDYLNAGTMPWNFSLAAATLTSYKNGFYGKYFGDNTIVGQSANNYVVSFGVNTAGKIDTVFMAASADLLM